MASILHIAATAKAILLWFTQPHVWPLVGAATAVVSALSLDPWAWIRSPFKAIGWAVRVMVVWLLVVWLIGTAITRWGPGGPHSNGNGATQPDPGASAAPAGPVTSDARPANASTLTIRFLPQTGNPAEARPFCCQLVLGERTETVEASNMPQMEEQFKARLKELAEGSPFGRVVFVKAPFPGEPVRQVFAEWLHQINPAIEVDLVTQTLKE